MRKLKAVVMTLMLLAVLTAGAQNITSVHGTLNDDLGPLMGATVCEIDATGRIIESAVTDLNGNFTMKIRNQNDKIRFSYVGLKTVTLPINKTTYNLTLQSATVLKEVTVKSKRRMQGNNLPIPQREVSYATQTISMKEFEGLGITSVDEALQGRIAGLDIVGASGDLGSGSAMRLRGASSLSSLTSSQPLIVVDGNIRNVDLENFDVASANNEKFADLLNVNPEDIASITVLKDASATAIYGSQGGNGVIELTMKRGARGKPRLTYSLKLSGTYQPKGYEQLNGDDYTMLLKESHFNPSQSEAAANIPELMYDPNYSEYQQYNRNTDWRDAVTQWGLRQNHYVTVSGGGEKATFRIGAGYDHETGTIIKQKLQRFSTRVALDYNVSERIRVQTNFSLTYTDNNRNWSYRDGDWTSFYDGREYVSLLSLAQRKMPNMTLNSNDKVTGTPTDEYYTMLQSGSGVFANDQRVYPNPVAVANLAKVRERTYDMTPELVINYQLLGTDDEHWQLNYRGNIYMHIMNRYTDRFYPQELRTVTWQDGAGLNTAFNGSSNNVKLNTKQMLTLIPAFENKDHSLMAMGRFELETNSGTGQEVYAKNLPSGGIENPEAGGVIQTLKSWYNPGRSMFYRFSTHYAYKGRYVVDLGLSIDGTTRFGENNRWGYFPSASLKWIISDESWMEKLKPVLSMLAVRPSWGRVGNQPRYDYLYVSQYYAGASYLGETTMMPGNIRLTDLKWEIVNSYNIGVDLGFFDDRLNLTFEAYTRTTTDMLMDNYRVPSNSGFATIPYRNTGKMNNTGWEFHINTNRLIKKGKFTFDMNANFGNNRNEILEMDPFILDNKNSNFEYKNGEWLRRVQLHNPLGSIYGFRSKGVYQYTYNYISDKAREFSSIDDYHHWIENTFLASGKTAPIVLNEAGKPVYGSDEKPLRMMYNYTNEGTGYNYGFQGGDAIYEDVNHDGQINALDIVYLGSSLPTLTGGFGFTFSYGDWRLSTQFNYRVGNKIINMARLNAESMRTNNNQNQAVNYRWRKNGDITTIPRAMYGETNQFNTLVSDRFVENGSYLRMSYAQLSYAIKKKYLKWIGLNKISCYASVNNPFVITKYSGVDPDISQWGFDPARDDAQTPRSRSYTLGITVDF